MSSLVRGIGAAMVVLGLLVEGGSQARACENDVAYETDRRIRLLARAEKDLDEGRFTMAAQAVANEFVGLRKAAPGTQGLWDRSMRILALAISRTGGAIRAGREWRSSTPAEREANVQWAVGAMRALVKVRKNEPAIQTDLGEVLSREPKYREEALKILGDLAAKDLVTSARGYRALAALRDDAGDGVGRDAALQRCRAMAKKADLCRIGDARRVAKR